MWLTSDLITDVRRRAMLPTTSLISTADTDILAHANSEMSSRIIPTVLSANEEFYVTSIDVPVVSGTSAYRVPNRSIGGRIREVQLLQGNILQNLTRLEPEQLTRFTSNASGYPMAFYMDAGALNLIPTPGASGVSIRLRYYVRPGAFTSTSTDYGIISSVTYNSSTSVTLGIGGGLNTPSNGTRYDIIAYRPPFEYLCVEGVASGSGVGTVTLTLAGLSPNIAVGDYITKQDLSPIMQCPVEVHSWLVQLTTCAFLEQLNYGSKLAPAKARADELEAQVLKLITPRTDGAPRKMRGLLGPSTRFGWWG